MNYAKFKCWNPFMCSYAFLDTREHLADRLFIQNKVRVWFGKEFANESYRVIFCKIRKKDENAFVKALEQLPTKAILLGYTDYSEVAKTLQSALRL